VDVADRGEDHEAWLKEYLALPHGAASRDTYSRVFRLLGARVFENRSEECRQKPELRIPGKTLLRKVNSSDSWGNFGQEENRLA
jgi:hypothetical protein